MREIKFRGHTGGSWVYGNLIQFTDSSGKDHAQIEETKWDDFGCWNVDPESVGQFTGLVDRNGVEIYEGDTVLCNRSGQDKKWASSRVVEYKDNICGFDPFIHIAYREDYFEVIGNIHENPELVQDSKNAK